MGETLVLVAAAFVFGYVVPMWALLSLLQQQKETNSLLRHIAERTGAEPMG